MAPNLKELSLRRLQISDQSVAEIFSHTEHLERLDISECVNVGKKALLKGLEVFGSNLKFLQASSLYEAVDDEVVTTIANLEEPQLEFLDLSFSKLVTDEGLQAFEGKTFKIEHLCLNGLSSITSKGLCHPILAC